MELLEMFETLELNTRLELDLTSYKLSIGEAIAEGASLKIQLDEAVRSASALNSEAASVKDEMNGVGEAAKDAAKQMSGLNEVFSGLTGIKSPTDLAVKLIKGVGEFAAEGISLAAEDQESQEFVNAMNQLKENIRSIKKGVGEVLLPVSTGMVNLLTLLSGGFGEKSLAETFGEISRSTAGQLADANGSYSRANALIGMLKKMEENGEESAHADSKWIATLNALIATVPELSKVINLQTGEIEGGTQALYENAQAWHENSEAQIEQDDLDKRIRLYRETKGKQQELELKKVTDQQASDDALRYAYELAEPFAEEYYKDTARKLNPESEDLSYDLYKFWEFAKNRADDKKTPSEEKAGWENLRDQIGAYLIISDEAKSSIVSCNEELDKLDERLDPIRESVRAQAEAMGLDPDVVLTALDSTNEYTDALLEQRSAYEQLSSAMELVRAYRESTIESMRASLDGLTNGFEAMGDIGQTSVAEMIAGLASQQSYMDEYRENLKKASELGIGEDMLASLADGSTQSAMYLAAIVGDQGASIQELKDQWDKTQESKDTLAEIMADARLEIDDEYKQMVADAQTMAQETVDAFDRAEEARSTGLALAQSLAAGLAEGAGEISEEVSDILVELAKLGSFRLAYSGDGLDGIDAISGAAPSTSASNLDGLSYVPYNDYLSYLHKGEAVLTAAQADEWRAGRTGGEGISAEAIASAVASAVASVISGFTVQMDGQTVGNLVTDTVSRNIAEGMTTTRRYAVAW